MPMTPLLESANNNGIFMEVNEQSPPMAVPARAERRHAERRKHVLRALFHGSLRPRRRGPRRAGESAVSAVDWHHPQWLAIAVLIVTFSCSDAFLTLMLLEQGAYEVNPLMAPLLHGSGLAFALVKIGLTASGVVLLTQLVRIRAFGRISVGLVLYTVLALYGALLVYEFRLLNRL
jgi:Domain of unknown function (DUF5658)